jgi:hypothetical protein
MVNIRTAPGAGSNIRDEEHSLAQLIQRGNLLPVIAGEALEDLVFGSHDRLVASYATHVGYPMPDSGKLHKVAKYQSLTTGWKDSQLKQDSWTRGQVISSKWPNRKRRMPTTKGSTQHGWKRCWPKRPI